MKWSGVSIINYIKKEMCVWFKKETSKIVNSIKYISLENYERWKFSRAWSQRYFYFWNKQINKKKLQEIKVLYFLEYRVIQHEFQFNGFFLFAYDVQLQFEQNFKCFRNYSILFGVKCEKQNPIEVFQCVFHFDCIPGVKPYQLHIKNRTY